MTSALPLIATLALGAFIGSWHCAAMCGPIALSLGRQGKIQFYHLGRAISYIGSGILAGEIGHNIIALSSTSERILGALILSTFFLLPLFQWKYSAGLHRFFRKLSAKESSVFLFGFFSVLLPCGWLWTFLAAAAASTSPWSGALIMTILWLSSLPALSLFHRFFKESARKVSAQKNRWIQWTISGAGLYSIWSHFFL